MGDLELAEMDAQITAAMAARGAELIEADAQIARDARGARSVADCAIIRERRIVAGRTRGARAAAKARR